MAGQARRLGELLVAKRLITEAQLAAALAEQRNTKEFLGTLLIRKGWVTREAMLQTLAEQLGIAYVHLDLNAVDWAAAARFATSTVTEDRCLPIAVDRRSVTVAVVNPLDVWGVGRVEERAGGRAVKMVLVSEEDFAKAAAEYRRHAAGSAPRR